MDDELDVSAAHPIDAIDDISPVWTTEELRRDFEVEAFQAPYVIVIRKSDGVRGSLAFDHHPRRYYHWSPL